MVNVSSPLVSRMYSSPPYCTSRVHTCSLPRVRRQVIAVRAPNSYVHAYCTPRIVYFSCSRVSRPSSSLRYAGACSSPMPLSLLVQVILHSSSIQDSEMKCHRLCPNPSSTRTRPRGGCKEVALRVRLAVPGSRTNAHRARPVGRQSASTPWLVGMCLPSRLRCVDRGNGRRKRTRPLRPIAMR